MSRLRRQDNKGWIDEGPRTPHPEAPLWPPADRRAPVTTPPAMSRETVPSEYRSYRVREVPA